MPDLKNNPYSSERIVPGRCQILALDGGGIKGLFSAAMLAEFEEDTGTRITDHFDLIAGTSTGGIIALALASGMRPGEVVRFYEEMGPSIFRKHLLTGLQRWFTHKYSQPPLKKALIKVFGEHQSLADLKKRVVVPSFNLSKGEVYIFKTPHHPRLMRDGRTPLWKVALATSAAPTFFPVSTHVQGIRHIDGGVWANNPSLVAVLEARSMLGVSYEDIHILNIGTTTPLVERPRRLNKGGLLIWAPTAAGVIMEAQSKAVHGQLLHLLPRENVTRFDAPVPDKVFQLDRAHYGDLKAEAAHASRKLCPQMSKFLEHRAALYEPFNGGER